MTKLIDIQTFLNSREIAVCGVSRNVKKFGRAVYDSLKKKGFTLYPVNPNTPEINGNICYKDVSELPGHIRFLLVVTPKDETTKIIEKAIDKGIKNIWIQQRSETTEAIALAEQNGILLIQKECILKFAEPVTGAHKFHQFMSKLFGAYPK